MRAQFAGKLQASRRPANDDQPARAADLGRDHAHHPNRAGPLHDHRVADLDIAAQRGMNANRKRLSQHAHLRRRLRLDQASHRVRQVDVVGEAPAERLIRAAETVASAAIAGMKDHPVSLLDRRAEIVRGHPFAQCLDDADIFMPQHRFRVDALLPVVYVGAADAA